MNKKKIKKIILISIITTIVLFIIHIIRNDIIISNLESKFQDKVTATNVYEKIQVMKNGNNWMSWERWIKGENSKECLILNEGDFDSNNTTNFKRVYYKIGDTNTSFIEYVKDGKADKVMYVGEDNYNFEPDSILFNDFYEYKLKTIIKSEKIDNKNYYVIIRKIGGEYAKLYINKETGLPVQIVYGEQTRYYIYEFGTVSDKDFEFPDVSQYKKEDK